MAQIKVDFNKLPALQSNVSAQRAAMADVKSSISSVIHNLDMQVSASADIDRVLRSMQRSSARQSELLGDMTTAVDTVQNRFVYQDNYLTNRIRGMSDVMSKIFAHPQTVLDLISMDVVQRAKELDKPFGIDRSERAQDGQESVGKDNRKWYEKVADGVRDFAGDVVDGVKKGVETIKTGVANVVDSAKDTVAGWVQDYKDKGTVFKVVNTALSIGSIVAAGAGIAAAWTASALTAGAGVPGAVLATGYGVNDIANELTDIKNCWWGDVNDVNQVNHLENMLEDGGGDIAEMMGYDREAGEKFGSALYTAGDVLTIVTDVDDLVGKTIQAPSLLETMSKGAKEVGTGVSGVIDIITHSPISELGKDWALLKHQIPNLVETAKTLDHLGDVYDTGKSLLEKSSSIYRDVTGGFAAAWN